ncbi:hypothetical protein DFH06DRAFT_1297402 [Mycena polygramma]|nr:hypothetical protein DFH06DRAFT_1297402 [Mycena polygramma]
MAPRPHFSRTQQNHKLWISYSPVTTDNCSSSRTRCTQHRRFFFFIVLAVDALCYSYPAHAFVTSRRCVSLFRSSPSLRFLV